MGSMIVEVVGELFSNSLAILTKITNSLLNIVNFAIAMFATWKVGWKTAPHQSFEFYQLHIDYKHLFLYKLYDWSPQYWHIKQIYIRNYEFLKHVYHFISRYPCKTLIYIYIWAWCAWLHTYSWLQSPHP